jgi:hypothetical protein
MFFLPLGKTNRPLPFFFRPVSFPPPLGVGSSLRRIKGKAPALRSSLPPICDTDTAHPPCAASRWPEGPDLHNRGSSTYGRITTPTSACKAVPFRLCPAFGYGRTSFQAEREGRLYRGSMTHGYEDQALRAIAMRGADAVWRLTWITPCKRSAARGKITPF